MSKNNKKTIFLEKLKSSYGIISTACEQVGISRRAYYDWCKKDTGFKEQVQEIMETQIDRVETHLLKLISEQNPAAIIFYLKTKGKNRGYSERFENINADVSTGKQIDIELVKKWLNSEYNITDDMDAIKTKWIKYFGDTSVRTKISFDDLRELLQTDVTFDYTLHAEKPKENKKQTKMEEEDIDVAVLEIEEN